MAFPVTIHKRIAPGTDPNNPNGVCEAVHKQLKQAVQNHGVNSPFTLGIVRGLAEGSHLIMVSHDQARQSPISLKLGRTQDQVLMDNQAIEQVR